LGVPEICSQISLLKAASGKSGMTRHLLIIGDALKVLQDSKYFPAESVNLVVTSPPYGLGKDYGGSFDDNFELPSWVTMLERMGTQIYRVLKPDGSFYLNVSPVPKRVTKEIIPMDSYAYFALKKCGFYLRNKVIWHFNNMQNCTRRLSGRWEAILWFVKNLDNYVFNLDAVRVPYLTNDKRISGFGRNPTDVWYFNRVNNVTKKKLGLTHPCIYPEPMIERIIKMSSNPADMVLDPFVGSGTTMKVAKVLNRNSIGIEINRRFKQMIKSRMGEDGESTLEVVEYDKRR